MARECLCYNVVTMQLGRQSQGLNLKRGQVFWLVVAAVFVLYGIMRLGAVQFLSIVVSLVVGITIHECAHAWTADQLGDPTARYLGRVSLNPLVHLDPAGTVMMAVTAVTGMGIGWGKPVPVSPHRLRYGSKLGSGIVSLAGPASNLLLATALGLVFRVSLAGPIWVSQMLYMVIQTNVVLAIFNLLPLPPLDGFGVLVGILSLVRARWAWRVQEALGGLARYGGMILLVPPARWLMALITGIG